MTGTVTLLHTNDLHGRLTRDGAERLAALKEELAPCLLLDSGDAVARGNVDWRRDGEPAHDLMRLAGYDAGALGNREFHFRPGPQRCKLKRAPFPVLCANLAAPAGYGGIVAHCRLTPAPGLTLLVLGLLVPMVTARSLARLVTPVRFIAPASAVARVLAEASGAATICLSHLGLSADRELAAAGLGLDLILGGHSHTGLPEAAVVGGTPIFQNHPHAVSLTVVRLAFDQGRLTAVSGELRPWPGEA